MAATDPIERSRRGWCEKLYIIVFEAGTPAGKAFDVALLVELFTAGAGYILVIRVLRMLRVFRILKMARHLKESAGILNALRSARPKITVFLFAIASLTIIMGTLIYIIEGGQEGGDFTSIPRSIYWSIVTITTVGYGDITPDTILGQFVAAIMMIMGYAIIAVPTGVITVELIREVQAERRVSTRTGSTASRFLYSTPKSESKSPIATYGTPIIPDS